MVENLFKICVLGVAAFLQPSTPQNVIATDDAGGNSHISVTTGWRHMAQNLRNYHVSISVLKRNFSLFLTQNSRKIKIATIFGKFFGKFTYE